MTTSTYTPPESPADPEAAALDLIVHVPKMAFQRDDFTPLLQDYCGILHAEGAFAGMAWADAKPVAVAVSTDACLRDDAAEFLQFRATMAATGDDNMEWQDRAAVVRAFTIAARVLG